MDLVATTLLGCSFLPFNNSSHRRCSPEDSRVFSSSLSLLASHPKVEEMYNEDCPESCIQTRYSVSPIISDLSDSVKQKFRTRVQSGTEVNLIVMKFYMLSQDTIVIKNIPQPMLQILAEVGGMMAFFLGVSVISLVECLLYCCSCLRLI